MNDSKMLLVSHAPFIHSGGSVAQRNFNILYAALPAAVLGGIFRFGAPAIAVLCFSIATAMLWELGFNLVTRQPVRIGDGNAALIGLLFAMLLPATAPWWLVLTGTFVAVIIGKHIFGGIGANAFNPVALSMAILMVSWRGYFDFDAMLIHYDLDFAMAYPLAALKHFGTGAVDEVRLADLLLGRQSGAIGATFGLGLLAGGLYLLLRGFIRWEITLSFLAGIIVTSLIFNIVDPDRFAGPGFHIFTGYTLIGAIFLAPEDASSPVNFVPMLIYGAAGGMMTILIRNIGAYVDGTILAILVINMVNPLIDKIRPKAMGKAV